MLPQIKQIGLEFKEELKKLYGDELSELILFGSYARGDFNENSDIDFAVILKNPNTRGAPNILKISEINAKLNLKYNELISVFPTSFLKLTTSNMPIFREIRKDGIKL